MSDSGSLVNFGVTRVRFVMVLIIILNAFTWYLVAFEVLAYLIDNTSITAHEINVIWTVHFGGLTCAALVGAVLSNRLVSRNNLLALWMSLGVVSSLVPILVGTTCPISIMAFSLLLGVAFGLGMPSCMGCYADVTRIEKRGRFGGVIYFAIGIGTSLLWTTLIPFIYLTEQLMILTIWRGVGLVTFLVLKPKDRCAQVSARTTESPSYTTILRRKPLLLYLIPWIMFCLISSLTRPILLPDVVRMSMVIGSIITGLAALLGGLFSDLVGRKRVVITGFVMLGIGYAMLGIFPDHPISHYLFTFAGSIAWGMFGAVFLMALWGDLAEDMTPEKFYAVGGLPYLLTGFLDILVAPYISELIPLSATFSFASFFLFLAVLPLLYAPETLPQKKIKERELKQYLEKARKIKEEYG